MLNAAYSFGNLVYELRIIAALFSMLMPGIGQIYNRQFIRGIIFLVIEHYDNLKGHINTAIYLEFNGFHHQAIKETDFGSLLFYPGFYIYCVWDAWYFAKPGADKTKTAIPFIIGGFIGEMSAIYAGRLPYPIFITALSMIIPMVIGMIIFRKQ